MDKLSSISSTTISERLIFIQFFNIVSLNLDEIGKGFSHGVSSCCLESRRQRCIDGMIQFIQSISEYEASIESEPSFSQ